MTIFLNIFGHSHVLLFLYILIFSPFKILITAFFFFCMIFVYTLDSKIFIFFIFLTSVFSQFWGQFVVYFPFDLILL